MLADGLMLLGMHKDKTLTLHALEVTSCEMVESRDVAVVKGRVGRARAKPTIPLKPTHGCKNYQGCRQ